MTNDANRLKALLLIAEDPAASAPDRVHALGTTVDAATELVDEAALACAELADPKRQPVFRILDIRALLDLPKPNQDKPDQFLDWLAEQERLEPRLRVQ